MIPICAMILPPNAGRTWIISVFGLISSVVQSAYGLSTDCADVLQGIILFFIMAMEFFVRYKIVFRGRRERAVPPAAGKNASETDEKEAEQT